MSDKEVKIVLPKELTKYFVGEHVSGQLVLELPKDEKHKGIFIRFRGRLKYFYKYAESALNRAACDKVTYVDELLVLAGSKSKAEHISSGRHSFPFSFRIPDTAPSTMSIKYDTQHVYIKYKLKGYINRSMKFNKSKKIEIFVHQHLPPSYVIPYLQPLSKSKTDTFKKHLFAKALPMHFSASVPRSIYRVNESVPIQIELNNESEAKLLKITASLVWELVMDFHRKNHPTRKVENVYPPVELHYEPKNGKLPIAEFRIPQSLFGITFNRDGVSSNLVIRITLHTKGMHSNSVLEPQKIKIAHSSQFPSSSAPRAAFNR